MSEPVSNAAIEDVLSSIRRLVSEESRGEEVTAQPEDVAKPPRLVLTPSLRVAEPVDAQATPVSQITPQKQAAEERERPESVFVNEGNLQEILDPSDVADAGEAEDWAQLTGDDVAAPETGGTGDMITGATDTDISSEDAPWSDPENTLFSAARVEVLTDPVVVPDHSADVEDVNLSEDMTQAEETLQEVSDEIPDPVGEDAPLSSRIAALETVISQSDDQWEPDGDFGDDYAGTATQTIAWQDHIESDAPSDYAFAAEDEVQAQEIEIDPVAGPEPMAGVTEDAPTGEHADHADPLPYGDREDLDVLAGDDTILDEESLRELVADIVRQELQGALGERITRNVRKLVRREIHRALVAQELE